MHRGYSLLVGIFTLITIIYRLYELYRINTLLFSLLMGLFRDNEPNNFNGT